MGNNIRILSGEHPTSQIRMIYMCQDLDVDNDIKYYGFINHVGNWYIIREVTTLGTFRYTAGKRLYTTNWTNRADLTYDYWSEAV